MCVVSTLLQNEYFAISATVNRLPTDTETGLHPSVTQVNQVVANESNRQAKFRIKAQKRILYI